MSNGSGPIIIRSLIDADGTTDAEREWLRGALERYEVERRLGWQDAWKVCRIAWRLLR